MLARHANPRVTVAVYPGLTDGARGVAVDSPHAAAFCPEERMMTVEGELLDDLDLWPRGEEETMRKPKRDVRGFIDKSIEYQRGSDTKAPPGGFASGLDRVEADLVYMSVRRTLEAVGVTLKLLWSPAGQGGEKKLADAYRNRGLNPRSLDR